MINKSSLYTRTGDLGSTALADGTRVKKNHLRVSAYGDIDELNSFIGLLLSTNHDWLKSEDREFMAWTQNKLFDLGAYLATDSKGSMTEAAGFGQDAISKVEHEIDRLDSQLEPLKAFILPGGALQASLANVCRTICRRAERHIVTLNDNIWVDPNVLRFINRLSDYFFALGRYINFNAHVEEKTWHKEY